ncbi:PIN domain-containing protein [Streptomyces sp. NPDC056549]|uniref:PIN domain-containing protein n=1 Tax=Streptomyces sp. NPDC056549 TaxID=3345864 RepID=UPI0036A93AE3
MIILDANILKGTSLRGPAADVLRAIRATGGERVAAPWIAVEEVAAQQALAYERKHEAAVGAVNELRKATPWEHVPHPKRWGAERVRDHWRQRYGDIAEVIETSAEAYQQAMFRETNLIAPCKTVNSGKNKTGARDAAIWLTAVEYARDNPEETVYFVSDNTEDFGDGTSFPKEMARDIWGVEDRFFLFTSLDGVLTKFATELEASAEDVKALLDTEEAQATVLRAARNATKRYRRFDGLQITLAADALSTTDRLVPGMSSPWRPTEAVLDEVLEVSGREVGGHHWFTAWVRWVLSENKPRMAFPNDRLAYAWETRVLLSPTADHALTVLDFRRPGPIGRDEIHKLPDVPRVNDALITLSEEQANRLLSTPAMQEAMGRILAPSLTQVEAAIGKLMSQSRASRDLAGKLAQTVLEAGIDPVEED